MIKLENFKLKLYNTGIIMTVERRAEAKISKLKDGLNALIKETDLLKQELNKKQATV